jgi:hypothetical protein
MKINKEQIATVVIVIFAFMYLFNVISNAWKDSAESSARIKTNYYKCIQKANTPVSDEEKMDCLVKARHAEFVRQQVKDL